jgi:amino-acid N-acetyltransferase
MSTDDEDKLPAGAQMELVTALRASAPYVHAHRGRTFVIHLPGSAAASPRFVHLIYDIALLASLGVRLVIVFGARPQINETLEQYNIRPRFSNNIRVSDKATLDCVRQAVGSLQMSYEAHLSTSLVSTPMGSARITTASGNLVTARPIGVVDGVNHGHTGEIRRIDAASIEAHLERGHIVLLSCIGYSPSGEIFDLVAEDVASATATALAANKLVLMHPGGAMHARFSESSPGLTIEAARALLHAGDSDLAEADKARLEAAIAACSAGVERCHLVSFEADGALLRELYSHDGMGTMVAADTYDDLRTATPEDLGGILALIEPMSAKGLLVPRSREAIELDIDHYVVMARDGLVTACSALLPYPNDAAGELACVAVHPGYRGGDRAARLLAEIEKRARGAGLSKLFVLTTRAPHWFLEHGFTPSDLDALPPSKRQAYNHQRNSMVLIKPLAAA